MQDMIHEHLWKSQKVIHFKRDKWIQDGKEFYYSELSDRLQMRNFVTIQMRNFKNFLDLKELHIECSNIQKVDANSFDKLQSLTNLELADLQTVPEFLFQNLKHLNKLEFINCKELQLNKNHFHGLDNLEELKYNGKFDGEIDNLINLKKLTLDHFVFEAFTFEGFEKIEELKLTNIKLTAKTSKNLFQNLTNLKRFHFLYNILKHDYTDPTYKISVVEFSESELNSMMKIFKSIPSQVEFLCCDRNVFRSLESSSVPFTNELKSLELLVTGYLTIESFTFPNIDNYCSNHPAISIEHIKSIKTLKALHLSNLILEGVDEEFNYLENASFGIKIPDNILNFFNLKVLSLENLMRKIVLTESFLKDLIHLEELSLSSVFDSIDSNVQYLFRNAIKLKKLKMYSNEMNILKSTYFDYLVNLKVLDLSRNEIKSIEQSPFKNLAKLTHLNLSYNHIHEINKTNLNGLFELIYLFLEFNGDDNTFADSFVFRDEDVTSFGKIQPKKEALLKRMNKLENFFY